MTIYWGTIHGGHILGGEGVSYVKEGEYPLNFTVVGL